MAGADLACQIDEAIAASSGGAAQNGRLWQESGCLLIQLETAGAADAAGLATIILEVRQARPGQRAYRIVDNLAFGYRTSGQVLLQRHLALLDRVIVALARLFAEIGFDPSRDTVSPKGENSKVSFPTPYHHAYLESETPLDSDLIRRYREDGHVLVRRAVHRDVILSARPFVLSALERSWPHDLPAVHERPDAYSRAFTQIVDIGLQDPVMRTFTHSRRIARMAADLMGVDTVRLLCEDWLVKEAGASLTPWHQDEAVYPFDARATITCWIPLQDVGEKGGLLRFARGSHRIGLAPIENINDVSEGEFARIIEREGLLIDRLPPMYIGDVSFHNGRTVHGAFPNESEAPRIVLALHYFAGDARLKAPTTPTMAALLENAVPNGAIGDPASSSRWPLVYEAAASIRAVEPRTSKNATPAFHLRATSVWGDNGQIDIWIKDGRIRFRPVEGAEELAPPGGFVFSGLVDCHSHISYPHERDTPVHSESWMNARRDDYAATGVLLLRDMGAVDDAISSLVDVPGLPRVHACGNMILPYDEFPFTCTKPEHLVEACSERVRRGARWVKVFADWTSDYRGRIDAGFTGNDDVTYSAENLARAVNAVHMLGGRVAAHCFTRAGAEVAILAGADSLEHGWGLDEALLSEMAARKIGWVPLVGIAPSMWEIARRERDPARLAWIEEAMDRVSRLLPIAVSMGVEIYAGTDRFPEVTVADEIRQLCELGLSPERSLAAGAWAARKWLGEPGLEEGAPADIVLYRSDPRRDLDVLSRPELILVSGERVRPSFAHVRPRYRTWSEREID